MEEIQNYLKFAEDYVDKPESYWNKIELFVLNYKQYVWREENTPFQH